MLPVVELNPVAGLQVYVMEPLAVSGVELFRQIVADGTVTAGFVTTVTLVVAVFMHPAALAPVIVYTVVEEGLAVTVLPLVELSPVPGLQV